MIKKITAAIVLCIVLLTALLFVFSACGGTETVKVSFVQEGRKTIVREVEKGGTIGGRDIPQPAKTTGYGYTVKWDKTDFKNITEDILVTAREVPKTLIVTYHIIY